MPRISLNSSGSYREGFRLAKAEIYSRIVAAINAAPISRRTAEMHLQMLKYATVLSDVSGREFSERTGLNPSYGTEFLKMKNIADRLEKAGLDFDRI